MNIFRRRSSTSLSQTKVNLRECWVECCKENGSEIVNVASLNLFLDHCGELELHHIVEQLLCSEDDYSSFSEFIFRTSTFLLTHPINGEQDVQLITNLLSLLEKCTAYIAGKYSRSACIVPDLNRCARTAVHNIFSVVVLVVLMTSYIVYIRYFSDIVQSTNNYLILRSLCKIYIFAKCASQLDKVIHAMIFCACIVYILLIDEIRALFRRVELRGNVERCNCQTVVE